MPRWQGVIGSLGSLRAMLVLTVVSCAVLTYASPAPATPLFLTPAYISDAGQDGFEPQVAVDEDGNEHHIWTRFDGANTRIQYRLRDQAGNFGSVQTLSTAGQDASQPQIDLAPNGDAVAIWTRSDGSHLRVEGAARPAGGSFGSVQVVSAAGQNSDQPRLSVDDSGRAVAVWVRYDVGASGTGRIQSSIRPAGGSFGTPATISEEGQVTVDPQVDTGAVTDENTVVIWSRSDGSNLRVQSARRRDVTGFPRPKGANPLLVALTPAYNACTVPNRTHGPGLEFPSCNPPVRSSGPLTVGSPDANGFAANSVASVRFAILDGDPSGPPDEADIKIVTGITDVRNHPSGSDYTGRVLVTAPLKITDNANSAETPEPGTTQQGALQFPVQCAATADTTRGGQCNLTTTYDTLVPGAVRERMRAIWELGQIVVKDAGPNGTGYASCPPTCGDGDETVFLRQGIFVP